MRDTSDSRRWRTLLTPVSALSALGATFCSIPRRPPQARTRSDEEYSMTEILQVTATTLNLRRSPAVNPNNIIGHLGHGELVEKVAQPSESWIEVRNTELSGFVA